MKRICPLFLLFFFLAFVGSAFAHPPSDIIITYDASTKVLKAVIMHNVSNTQAHYIKTVDVGLNNNEILSQSINRQDNNESQTVSYLIPDTKPGDTLSVEAFCSISGKLKKEIKVPESK